MRPVDVNFRKATELRNRLYKDTEEQEGKPKFKLGDIVRITKEKGEFSKGYYPNFTDELFKIVRVNPTNPPSYRIEHMQKTLNTIIQSAYDAKFPKEKRAKRETVDKELEPEIEPKPDKELTREVPPSVAKDIELTREASLPTAPDIELQREAEPKESDKEMGREIGPPHLSDKQLSELEGEKGQKQPPPPPIIEQQRKISAVDQDRLNLAKRVTEQSSNETVKLAATAADIAEKAKTALNRAEQALKQAPNAPDVKKWFDKLSNMENNLRELVEKISHESKKAAEVTMPKPSEIPHYPAEQPKHQQEKDMEKLKPTVEKEVQIPKLPDDEKVTKGHPPKATVEKELELEPVKSQDKELERESPKKADKELEPIVKQQSSKEDLLLEEIKNEMDQTVKKVTQTANYIRTLVDNSKHNRGVAETRLKTYSDIPELKNWLDQIVELDQKIDELSKKVGNEPSKVISVKKEFDNHYRMKNLTESRNITNTVKNVYEVIHNYSLEIKQLNNKMHELNDKFTTAVKELEEAAKKGATITQQQEKVLEKEIPQEPHLKELEREKGQPDIPEDSSEKQPEPAEEQVEEVPYVPEKKEEKIEEEKAIFKEDTINEFPSTEYGIEDSDTDKTETGSPAQDKEKVLVEKDESLEQSDRQKEKAKILVISTDKKEEEFPSNEYDIEDEYASSSLTAAQNGLSIGTGVQHVDASSHLAYVLGFEGTRLYYNHPAKYLPDLSGGVRQLYVYAPKLVEDTIIGDRMAPLLRVVNVSGTGTPDVPEQAGRGEQQYFVGTRYQRGGGLLQNVARFLMPVASNLLSSASKEGIAAGTRVLGDLSQGKALKESLETHAKQGLENLAGKLQQCGKDSVEGLEGSLSMFNLPPTNVAINKTSVRELLPLSALNQTGPYLFRLFSDSQYCDLSKTYMYLLTSIERKNAAGEWVPTDDAIEEDRHVEVFDSSIYYHYCAYIMQELGYSHEIRKAFHEAGCYYSDENSQDSYSNKGFTSRVQRFSNGKHCETMDVVFTIHRNSDSFLLLTPRWKTVIDEVKDAQGNIVTAARVTWHDSKAEYRIRLHDMRLYLRTVDVEMRSIFLGTGRTELSHNVFTSTLPRRLICTFVSTGAYSGARHLSPFNFEHANVRSISAEANGLTFPSTPYLFSFGNQKRFVRAFVDMYAGLGLDDSDNKTVSISMARFLSGWAFFVIPMTSTLDDTPGFELIRQGTCTVKVQFEQPIKADGYEMLILVARCSGVPYCEVLATLHSTRTVANLLVKGSYPIHFESHRQIEPTACFEYNGKSYVFFEDRVADEMHIYLRQIRSTSSSSNISSENIGIFDPLELKTLADVSNGTLKLSNYFPNPLQSVNCVHIVNTEYENQPVIVEGTLDLVDHLLFSTCYPKKRQGIEWSEPLYVELSDLMVCPGDLPKCLSHFGQTEGATQIDGRRTGLARQRRHRRRSLVKALCDFNKCGPEYLAVAIRRRKKENIKYLCDRKIETVHLRKNLQVFPESFTMFGANRMYAYRGLLGITVEQHLYARHRARLKFPNLPCIVHVGGNGHQSYFPIELLKISSSM
ncbi:hypothetical protein niasHT_031017 [Heterodera trifolii]|uniref:Uncharacterized protein n=1 Tax=Heterodera trifolii TaxID=157864 RepID=A0ABD2IB53_9BILA